MLLSFVTVHTYVIAKVPKVYSESLGTGESLTYEHVSTSEHFEELYSDLASVLNLEKLEAQLYLHLLRTGPITGSALAKELDIDRARAYRTIDKMISTNIISTTFSSPKLCIPIEPEEALKLALRKKEEELDRIKKSGKKVIRNINDVFASHHISPLPTFRVVQGRSNVYFDIEQLIENSSDVVYIATTLKDVSQMYHTNIPEKITMCENRGGEVRLIVEMNDPSQVSYVTRFNATATRVGKLPSKGRMVVEKGKQTIMSDALSDPTQTNSPSHFSLVTNSYEIVCDIFTLCSLLWKNSKNLDTIDVKNYAGKKR